MGRVQTEGIAESLSTWVGSRGGVQRGGGVQREGRVPQVPARWGHAAPFGPILGYSPMSLRVSPQCRVSESPRGTSVFSSFLELKIQPWNSFIPHFFFFLIVVAVLSFFLFFFFYGTLHEFACHLCSGALSLYPSDFSVRAAKAKAIPHVFQIRSVALI